MTRTVVVVGAGIFGVTAAVTLRQRGWNVVLVDPGPIPHPLAASTDISKALRMDYGRDDFYLDLMREALVRWDIWNNGWVDRPWHADGFLFLSASSLETAGTFEHESLVRLEARGYRPTRLDRTAIAERFPQWSTGRYPAAYVNPRGGWAESGAVVAKLAAQARAIGVDVREGIAFDGFVESGSRVGGIRVRGGGDVLASHVVVAAGTWTPVLCPWLADRMWSVGQDVLHFRVDDPAAWSAPRFLAWGADIANTGWYGFPALPDGRLKVANHGVGRRMHPDEPREVSADAAERFRTFLRESLPGAAGAPLVGTRLCLYSDTFDGDFWIARDPDREGLVVAAGGAGHAFKFAPLLGGLVANAVDGVPDPRLHRFRWRRLGDKKTEHARNA